MNVREELRKSYKEQFGIVKENYTTEILLDSLIVTTEKISEIYKLKNSENISRFEAENKVKELKNKAKLIMNDINKETKRIS